MLDQILTAEMLATGSTMSWRNQPLLGELFTEMKFRDRRLVVIVGAGVSMDAGLPSWGQLVAKLGEQLSDASRQTRLTALGSPDLQRRAQQALYMLQKERPRVQAHEQVSAALFGGMQDPVPGEMAKALARLAALYESDLEIITTNFDRVLETALVQVGLQSDSYSLDGSPTRSRSDIKGWRSLDPRARSASVLHLHGMLGADDLYLPLVLTETDFSRFGSRVQGVIKQRIRKADLVLIVGMSLTDPNLLEPLRQIPSGNAKRFAIAVPDLTVDPAALEIAGGHGAEARARLECAKFAYETSRMLASDLELRPILLKSYGQVIQVLSDLTLAHIEPRRYRPSISPRSESLAYGVRFDSALKLIYRNLAFGPVSGKPDSPEAALAISNQWREAAKRPRALLRKFKLKHSGACAASEDFGFFLWLRDPRGSQETSTYALRLIAASTYHHWEQWSGENVQQIHAKSTFASALAVYSGRVTLKEIPAATRGIWRGSLAVPLVQKSSNSEAVLEAPASGVNESLDRITIGAISINTNAEVNAAAQSVNRSVLDVLTFEEQNQLEDALYEMASALGIA
jgi:hypothetical protein